MIAMLILIYIKNYYGMVIMPGTSLAGGYARIATLFNNIRNENPMKL
jgi:hypothetical protein